MDTVPRRVVNTRLLAPLLLLTAATTCLLACGIAWKRYGALAIDEAHGRVVDAGLLAEADARSRAVHATSERVRERVHAAHEDVVRQRERLLSTTLRRLVDAGQWHAVAPLRPHVALDDERERLRIDAHLALAAGNPADARALAWRAIRDDASLLATLLPLIHEAVEADPLLFAAEPATLTPSVDLDRLERLGGGSTITLKASLEGETVGVFKPWQSRFQSNYRAEIAAYRLCALIDCGFQVPINREVRIAERDFLRLYGLRAITPGESYAGGFVDLIFFTDEENQRWLHGTFKEWVPGFTKFPIETTSAWTWLVARSMTRERLETMDLTEALSRFRTETDKYTAILERSDGLTALDLARQLSNLHVFDHLINNWDRYSGAYPGVNCQFNHGHFVSIDNGAAFQSRRIGNTSDASTFQRLRPVEIFSRTTIEALRAMDTDRARGILLPPSPHHDDDDHRWELFLERRARLLAHVDQMVERFGEDRVLALP